MPPFCYRLQSTGAARSSTRNTRSAGRNMWQNDPALEKTQGAAYQDLKNPSGFFPHDV
jgi:hypothetical protein